MRIFTCLVALILSVMTVGAKPITQQQALKRASAFMAQQRDFRTLAAVTNAQKLSSKRAAGIDATVEPYYVFNKGVDEGFVIVSGDDQTIEVLGYCDDGSFDFGQLPPNLQELLDGYAGQIARIQQGAPVVKLAANHPKVEQLMTSKWSQGAPYNNSCPYDGNSRSVTGCVATAVAQILYYNREKSVTETTAQIPAFDTWTKKIHVNAVPAGSPIDWNNMKDTYGTASDLQKKAVADLMFYCGAAVKMDYTSSSSGAQSSDAYAAFAKYFGYGASVRFVTASDVSSDDEWDRIVYTEMAAGRPVYVSGANATVGHAFVADGYENQRYHINWGWGGQSDGFYYLTNLTPGDGQGIGGSEDGYNYYKQIVVGIEPENYMEKAMSISDATVKNVCLSNWDADKDGKLTYAEAASVTTLGDVFKGKSIKDFRELYYFTSLTSLSDDAFNGCSQLTNLRLPKSLKKVGARAFKDCAQLRQVNLPTSVNVIGEEAFSGCKLMTAFELPNEISTIEKGTFKDCQVLLSIDLPISVEKIGDEAFAGCTKLSSFTVSTFHPSHIQLGTSVFGGVNLASAKLTVMQGTKAYFMSADQWKDFGTVIELREISGGNFAQLEAGKTYYLYNVGTGRYLTKGEAYGTQGVVGTAPMRFVANHTATMADDVYFFTSPDTGRSGKYLFRTSSDGNVGSGVKAIFVDGTNLTAAAAYWTVKEVADMVYTIQVPSTVTASYVENEFLGVQTDHASNAASPTYGAYFDVDYTSHQRNCQWQFVLYDDAFAANYAAAEKLGNLLSMAKKSNVKCAEEQLVYDNLESSIEELETAQKSLRKRLNLIDFADNIVRDVCIGLFDADTNGELSYKEASEVSDFGYTFYFKDNTSLVSFNELQYFSRAYCLYGNTFEGCTNLESIVLPKGLTNIYYRVFYNCKKLKSVNIPEFVELIGDNCFYGCSALREVTVMNPDPSTLNLGTNVFGGVPLAQCTLYVPYGSKELYAEAPVWKNFGTIVEVRGRTQPKLSNFRVNTPGYIYNVATRKMITMGEAWGTQAIVGQNGRAYQLKRSNSMPDGTYYLFDDAQQKVVFRTNTDSKVGDGVKACFADGDLSTKNSRAYWHVDSIGEHIFTLQVPANDAEYVDGEYLGTDLNHISQQASPTYGIYYDVVGNSKNTQWSFIAAEDAQLATEMDQLVEKLSEMLVLAKSKDINVDDEQAVYDNIESTNEQMRMALTSVREKLHFITFADEKVRSMCMDKWDADGDGELTFEEAQAVTDIGEVFRGAATIKSFEELKYFTQLTEIPDNAFRSASNLQTLYLPKSVKKIGSSAFTACSVLRNLVILNDVDLIDYNLCGLINQARVFVYANMVASYEGDQNWSSKNILEYTGKPVVTAEASRIYGRAIATIKTIVMGAPVDGDAEASCEAISVATNPVGTYPITLKKGTITTPGVELREGVFTIEKAPLTITAKSYTRNVGEANPEFELTYKTFRNKETDTVFTKRPVITCDATVDSPAGVYDIVVSGAEAQNYEITFVNGQLTVLETAGIDGLKADGKAGQPIYDLQGRKVQLPKRGVYVSGKRKVIVK